ncbi:Uncharacterised protein [uncultured archaeon]|nr:Uncharacterised protein [uncultured archaeon]
MGVYFCGINQYEKGDLDKARDAFNKLLSNDRFEEKPNVYRWPGEIELSQMNYEEAKWYYKIYPDEG